MKMLNHSNVEAMLNKRQKLTDICVSVKSLTVSCSNEYIMFKKRYAAVDGDLLS